jgi:hypothetical protein
MWEVGQHTSLAGAGENALPCITASGVNIQALDLVVKNTRACWLLPRRASDVASRSLAQCHYPGPSSGSESNPQGPGPLPASISFSPPMHQYLMFGGLQDSQDACMRKAPSQMELWKHWSSGFGGTSGHGDEERPMQPSKSLPPPHPPVLRQPSLPSLTVSIPEGHSIDEACEQPHRQRKVKGAADVWCSAVPLPKGARTLPAMRMFTFLRLTRDLLEPGPKGHWMHFMSNMGSHQPIGLCCLEGT